MGSCNYTVYIFFLPCSYGFFNGVRDAAVGCCFCCTVCVITHTHTHSLIMIRSDSSCVSLFRFVSFRFVFSSLVGSHCGCVCVYECVLRQFELKYQMIKLLHTIFAAFAKSISFSFSPFAFTTAYWQQQFASFLFTHSHRYRYIYTVANILHKHDRKFRKIAR